MSIQAMAYEVARERRERGELAIKRWATFIIVALGYFVLLGLAVHVGHTQTPKPYVRPSPTERHPVYSFDKLPDHWVAIAKTTDSYHLAPGMRSKIVSGQVYVLAIPANQRAKVNGHDVIILAEMPKVRVQR
jgi:hypothetical protein